MTAAITSSTALERPDHHLQNERHRNHPDSQTRGREQQPPGDRENLGVENQRTGRSRSEPVHMEDRTPGSEELARALSRYRYPLARS
jgi:hypothetical protein